MTWPLRPLPDGRGEVWRWHLGGIADIRLNGETLPSGLLDERHRLLRLVPARRVVDRHGMTGFDESGFGGFNDLNVITFGGHGGNCVVGDFAEICTVF